MPQMFKALSLDGIDWSMTAEHSATLAMDAMMMAFWLQCKADALVHNSGLWSQCTSKRDNDACIQSSPTMRISWRNLVQQNLSNGGNSRPFRG